MDENRWRIVYEVQHKGVDRVLSALFGSPGTIWVTLRAVECTHTLKLSEWMRTHDSAHDLSSAARAVGIGASAAGIRRAIERATESWNAAHAKECDHCYRGEGSSPRGMHRPVSHVPTPPWHSAGHPKRDCSAS